MMVEIWRLRNRASESALPFYVVCLAGGWFDEFPTKPDTEKLKY